MKTKEPRFGEELERLRRDTGNKQSKLLVDERTWRKIVEGCHRVSEQKFTSLLSNPRDLGGLGIKDVLRINHFRILYGFPPLTKEDIEWYKLIPSSPESHAVEGSTPAEAPIAPRSALVAHYPFLANSRDISRYQNHARPVGNVEYDVREGRRGASLNAPASYFEVRHDASLALEQFTLCAWVYFDSTIKGRRRRIIEKGNSSSYWLYIDDDMPVVGFRDGQHYFNHPSSTILIPKMSYFVAGTFDSRFLRLYLNGEEDGSRQVPENARPGRNCEPLVIGSKYMGIRLDHLGGMISDVRIYNRALAGWEIHDLYITGLNVDMAVKISQTQRNFLESGLYGLSS
jgi:hypothetical protein